MQSYLILNWYTLQAPRQDHSQARSGHPLLWTVLDAYTQMLHLKTFLFLFLVFPCWALLFHPHILASYWLNYDQILVVWESLSLLKWITLLCSHLLCSDFINQTLKVLAMTSYDCLPSSHLGMDNRISSTKITTNICGACTMYQTLWHISFFYS